MTTRRIKSRADYEQRKEKLAALMLDKQHAENLREIEYLSMLLSEYEATTFALESADAIDAIRFRMEQLDLSPRDLEPYIGSRSRVSEILSGKRPLSLDMVRALNQHLQIPAEALIRTSAKIRRSEFEISKSLLSLLQRRNILRRGEGFEELLDRAGGPDVVPLPLFRRTLTDRANARTNAVALLAWTAGVVAAANEQQLRRPYRAGSLTPTRLREIAKISAKADWHAQIGDVLSNLGIAFVVLRQLPGTYVDGAAMKRSDGAPIVAMSLRHDRIDNFWFVLLHELSHIAKHFDDEDRPVFFDDLDVAGADDREHEADESAQNALLPPENWHAISGQTYIATEDIEEVAEEAGVHLAIVAGRVRRESGDYRRFSSIVGLGEVRKHFPDEELSA